MFVAVALVAVSFSTSQHTAADLQSWTTKTRIALNDGGPLPANPIRTRIELQDGGPLPAKRNHALEAALELADRSLKAQERTVRTVEALASQNSGLEKQVERLSARVSVLETDVELWVETSAVLGLVSGLAILVIGVSGFATSRRVTVIFQRR